MKEQYIVSARKYRPDSFDTMVGQEALTSTLKSAILGGKTAHAYLFCGPRGVGKTSTARVFAKTINCLHRTPEGEACNECESCVAFNQQRSLSIYELDAASNNTVDDIRQLIEQVQIPPQIGDRKVYIIDEVHMLSQAAFNAFLKTLEEPPAYVVFILATTEKHKVLPTILSRCQIYDFKRISVPDIANHLAAVAQQEGIETEPEALGIIAEKADGGMRDALSMFDRIANFSGGHVSYDSVIQSLNILDYEYYFRLVSFFTAGDYRSVLVCLDELLDKGFEAGLIVNGLASFFRDLLMAHSPETLPLLQKPESITHRYTALSAECTPSFIYRALSTLNDCDRQYKSATNKRLLVELSLMSLCALYSNELKAQAPAAKPTQAPTPQQTIAATRSPEVSTRAMSNRPSADTNKGENILQGQSAPSAEPPTKPQGRENPSPASTTPSQPTPSSHNQHPASMPRAMGERSKSRLIRLDGLRTEDSGSKETNPLPSDLRSDFTDEDLQRAWIEYATERLEDQIHQRVIMEQCLPRKAQGEEVAIEVITKSQADKLEEDSNLLQHLRLTLGNAYITMNFVVSPTAARTRPTTTEDKLASLSKENGLFGSFCDSLDLRPL